MKSPDGWICVAVSVKVSEGRERQGLRLYVVDRLVVKKVRGDDLLDDLLGDLLAELLGRDVLGVLCGDDNGVDPLGDDGAIVVLVLDGNLSLGVRSQPGQGAVPAGGRERRVQLVSEKVAEGVQLGGFVSGITKHDTLVTGTELLKCLLIVQALSDIRGLLLNGDQEVEGLVVEALGRVIIANVLDGITDNLLVVDVGLCGDLAKDHDHACLGRGLTGNLGQRVLGQTGVQDGVGDLVSDLVGVTLTDRLGCEQESALRRANVAVDSVGSVGSHCDCVLRLVVMSEGREE
jgi:hypothetical protein